MLAVSKRFMKEVVQNSAMSAVATAAISSYIRKISELSAAAADGDPPGWILSSNNYMTSLAKWMGQGLEGVLDQTLVSLEDMLNWNFIYNDFDEARTKELFEDMQTIAQDMEAGAL